MSTPLPPAPRDVPFRVAAQAWWPFGLGVGITAGVLLLLVVVFLAIDGFRLPTTDTALDRDAFVSDRDVRVESIERTGFRVNSTHVHRVHYTFTGTDGTRVGGHSYQWPGPRELREGGTAAVELLPGDESVHRLRGTVHAMSSLWLPTLMGWVLLPALFLLLLWFRRAWRTAVLLRQGEARPFEVESCAVVQGVNPPRLRVRYRFTAADGTQHEGGHWVPRNAPLGRLLEQAAAGSRPQGACVVHDPVDPSRNRLLAFADCASVQA